MEKYGAIIIPTLQLYRELAFLTLKFCELFFVLARINVAGGQNE